jgi:hypothetical protein
LFEKHGREIFALAVGGIADVRLDLVNVTIKTLTGSWVSMIERG